MIRIYDLLHTKLSEFTVANFMSVIIDNDLSVMVKSKGLISASHEDLQVAWGAIYEEYSNLVQADEQKVYILLVKQRCILQAKIYVTKVMVDSLSRHYCVESVKVIKRLGYDFQFTKKTIKKDLGRVLTLVKSLELDLIKVEEQLKPYLTETKIERADILKILRALSKHNRLLFLAETTSLETYITYLNDYKSWQIAQKSQK